MTQQLQQQRLVRSWTINLQLPVWVQFTSALYGSCAVYSPGFLTNPNLIQFKPVCRAFPSPGLSFTKLKILLFTVKGGFFETSLPLLSLRSCSFWLESFFFLTTLPATPFLIQNYVPAVQTWGIFFCKFMCLYHHSRLPWSCWRSRCLGSSCHFPNQHHRHRLLHPL